MSKSKGRFGYEITADASGFRREMASVKESGKKAGGGVKEWGQSMANATIVVGGLVSATSAAREKILELVDASRVQELAVSQMATTIERAGGDISTSATLAFASARQAVTNYGDEVTLQASRMLVPLAGTQQNLEDLIVASQDLAAAQGIDLKGATKQLADVMVKGSAEALLPYIGALTDEEKALLKTGDATDKVALLTAKMSTTIAGMAASEQSPLTRYNNALGDTKEIIGDIIREPFEDWLTDSAVGLERVNAELEAMVGKGKGIGNIIKEIGNMIPGLGDLADVMALINAGDYLGAAKAAALATTLRNPFVGPGAGQARTAGEGEGAAEDDGLDFEGRPGTAPRRRRRRRPSGKSKATAKVVEDVDAAVMDAFHAALERTRAEVVAGVASTTTASPFSAGGALAGGRDIGSFVEDEDILRTERYRRELEGVAEAIRASNVAMADYAAVGEHALGTLTGAATGMIRDIAAGREHAIETGIAYSLDAIGQELFGLGVKQMFEGGGMALGGNPAGLALLGWGATAAAAGSGMMIGGTVLAQSVPGAPSVSSPSREPGILGRSSSSTRTGPTVHVSVYGGLDTKDDIARAVVENITHARKLGIGV